MKDDKNAIDLGATARSPEDVRKVADLGFQFAEVPIKDPAGFAPQVTTYRKLAGELGIYYLCHGPREGDPNDMESLEKRTWEQRTWRTEEVAVMIEEAEGEIQRSIEEEKRTGRKGL